MAITNSSVIIVYKFYQLYFVKEVNRFKENGKATQAGQ